MTTDTTPASRTEHTMSTAQRIVDKLNDYEATHALPDHNIWDDVILFAYWCDERATHEANPVGRGNVVVLTDGTRIEHREGEWVIA